VNGGEVEDPSFHGRLYAVPEDADPYEPESWKLANPALGTFVSAEQIADEAERAKRLPTFEPAFLNLHCNIGPRLPEALSCETARFSGSVSGPPTIKPVRMSSLSMRSIAETSQRSSGN
jgi:hypothetical protein